MIKEYRFYNIALTFLAIAALCLGLAACGSSDNAEPECADNFDCDFGEACDLEEGVCGPIDAQNPPGRPSAPECTSNAGCPHGQTCNTGIGKCEGEGTSTNNPNPNNPSPNTCTPACGSGETCQSGTCVPDVDPNACVPACGSGETCQSGTCVPDVDPNACVPACGSGETCQSGTCVPDVDPNACVPACGSGETCQSGTCVPDDPNVCNPGCAISEHCDNGTCVPNASNPDDCNGACGSGTVCQAGQCVPDTSNPPVCSPACGSGFVCSGSNLCVPDGSSGGGTCTLWVSNNGCAANEVCNPVTDTEGICTSSIDPAPTDIGDLCSPAYETCGQMSDGFAVSCLENNGGSSSCFVQCRDGYGDCDFLDEYDFWDPVYYYCVGVGTVFPGAPNTGVCSQI